MNPAKKQDFAYANVPGMPDSFVVTITTSVGGQSFTYHRPIGQTGLGDDEWCATQTGDVFHLIERQSFPDPERLRKAVQTKQVDLAVQSGFLKRDSKTGAVKYPRSGAIRSDLLKLARELVRKEKKTAAKPVVPPITDSKKELSDIESPGSGETLSQTASASLLLEIKEAKDALENPPKTARFPDYFYKLDPEIQVEEEKYLVFLQEPSVLDEVAKVQRPLRDFLTMGGPLADQPQKPLPFLKGKSKGEAVDQIVRLALTGHSEVQRNPP